MFYFVAPRAVNRVDIRSISFVLSMGKDIFKFMGQLIRNPNDSNRKRRSIVLIWWRMAAVSPDRCVGRTTTRFIVYAFGVTSPCPCQYTFAAKRQLHRNVTCERNHVRQTTSMHNPQNAITIRHIQEWKFISTFSRDKTISHCVVQAYDVGNADSDQSIGIVYIVLLCVRRR